MFRPVRVVTNIFIVFLCSYQGFLPVLTGYGDDDDEITLCVGLRWVFPLASGFRFHSGCACVQIITQPIYRFPQSRYVGVIGDKMIRNAMILEAFIKLMALCNVVT